VNADAVAPSATAAESPVDLNEPNSDAVETSAEVVVETSGDVAAPNPDTVT